MQASKQARPNRYSYASGLFLLRMVMDPSPLRHICISAALVCIAIAQCFLLCE